MGWYCLQIFSSSILQDQDHWRILPADSFLFSFTRSRSLDDIVCKYCNTRLHQRFSAKERDPKKKLQKFGHTSKLGVPYLPCSLVRTKISLDKHSSVYSTSLPKKFGHFGTKVCSWILDFDRNFIAPFFFVKSLLLCMKKTPQNVCI